MSKIWLHKQDQEAHQGTTRQEMEFLEYQVTQWYNSLPEGLQLQDGRIDESRGRGLCKIRVLLALRANLAKIQIYRPILHSATNIHRSISHARKAVDIARTTISLLVEVNNSSNLYSSQQVLYNYFLVQALAVIFLAISHAPAEFLNITRVEFFNALGLVQHFSMKSAVSKRLWRTIRDLKDLRQKISRLGQTQRYSRPSMSASASSADSNPGSTIPRSSSIGQPPAAVFPTPTSTSSPLGPQTMNASQMSNDLLNLYNGVEQDTAMLNNTDRRDLQFRSHPSKEVEYQVQDGGQPNQPGFVNGQNNHVHHSDAVHDTATEPVVYDYDCENEFSRLWAELL